MIDRNSVPAGFENLEIWRRSRDLAVQLYRIRFDWSQRALQDQITRSALSISSNIAEGHERDSPAEFRRFLLYAKGSCGELRSQLSIAHELSLISKDEHDNLRTICLELSRMIAALIRRLES